MVVPCICTQLADVKALSLPLGKVTRSNFTECAILLKSYQQITGLRRDVGSTYKILKPELDK